MKYDKNICIVPGCNGRISVKKHKLCKPHVQRLYTTGSVGHSKVKKRKVHRPFSVL